MSKINETNYPRRTQASYEDTDMLVIQEAGGNTYTTRIEDLREDCQETLAPALNTMRENLATVEGSTASKAYAKGDFLVFGGRLCKAKTSIASGATLVLDTNIELDSVGDELSSLTSELASEDWQVVTGVTLNPSRVTAGSLTVLKNKHWCYVNFDGLKFSGSYNDTAFASGLPVARLLGTNDFVGANASATATIRASGDSTYIITNSGELRVNTGSAYATAHYGTLMYPV